MPGIIPEPVLEQIRQNNDVVEVIGSYFPLKRAGANFRALCPFHKEKTPSFNVNPKTNLALLRVRHGRRRVHVRDEIREPRFRRRCPPARGAGGIKLEYEERAGEPGRDVKESLLKLHDLPRISSITT